MSERASILLHYHILTVSVLRLSHKSDHPAPHLCLQFIRQTRWTSVFVSELQFYCTPTLSELQFYCTPTSLQSQSSVYPASAIVLHLVYVCNLFCGRGGPAISFAMHSSSPRLFVAPVNALRTIPAALSALRAIPAAHGPDRRVALAAPGTCEGAGAAG